MEMKTALKAGLPGFQPVLPDHTADILCAFGQAVIEQNKVMNLTAITDPVQVAKLHLLDSLTLTRCLDLKGKRLIDVGCGAGFPGVPIAIACPDTDVTLLDSLGKRVAWLEEILPELGISAHCVTARAEEAVASCRESFDVGRCQTEYSSGAAGPLCKGGGLRGRFERRCRPGGAGRMQKCDQAAGPQDGVRHPF